MGPENRFIQRVHKHLSRSVYREKMHNPYRGGTPDMWYSGPGGDVWVEYKWQKVPRSGVIAPDLSPLQLKWIIGRLSEGRNVAVMVGTPKGGALCLSMALQQPPEKTDRELASWIESICL